MLSYSTGKHGKGWVYAVNTAMDETGAMLGPLLIALVLFVKGGDSYRIGYGTLLVSSLLALAALVAARLIFPLPSRLEQGGPRTATAKGFTRSYWLYTIAGALFAAGLMSFELISFHLASSAVVTAQWIPIFLAIASAMSVVATLVLGRLYDRIGIAVVVGAVIVAASFSPFVFLGGFWLALVGLLLWGVGYAIQELIGSVTTALLYDQSRIALIVFAVVVQLASMPFFLLGAHAARSEL